MSSESKLETAPDDSPTRDVEDLDDDISVVGLRTKYESLDRRAPDFARRLDTLMASFLEHIPQPKTEPAEDTMLSSSLAPALDDTASSAHEPPRLPTSPEHTTQLSPSPVGESAAGGPVTALPGPNLATMSSTIVLPPSAIPSHGERSFREHTVREFPPPSRDVDFVNASTFHRDSTSSPSSQFVAFDASDAGSSQLGRATTPHFPDQPLLETPQPPTARSGMCMSYLVAAYHLLTIHYRR